MILFVARGGIRMEKILLVEDDAVIASGLSYALSQEGFEVSCAGNLKQASDCLNIESDGKKSIGINSIAPFDLILLDVMLPDGNGFDLCRQIKERWDVHSFF